MNRLVEDEPQFAAIAKTDPELQRAYVRAAESIPRFIVHLRDRYGDALYSAKLRFRDPDESERRGKDQLLYLWLTGIHYYAEDDCFSGVFFEVPAELGPWFQVGQQHVFEAEDIFDWMMLDHGHLHGGFTLRVMREKLPEGERAAYDQFIGVSIYEPLTTMP
ncbi:DUF2314 domain-containing protein [Luteolibacter sp. Populi]|uniref:DUF2314 domain-containing protein n=1 Tax=Luteolibacter sp. Populi TaxID=3230487 RepID=UPI0034654848